MLVLETTCGLSPELLATHMASGMPGALQMLPAVLGNFSAFFHVDFKTSAKILVIPHLSGGIDRFLTLESVSGAWSNSNAEHGISITL